MDRLRRNLDACAGIIQKVPGCTLMIVTKGVCAYPPIVRMLTGHPGGMAMEGAVSWRAETADWNQKDAGKRTCTRLMIRAYLAEGSEMTAQLQYDSDKQWHTAARVTGTGKGTIEVPLFPRRCDHCRLALSGVGEAEIFSIARDYLPG